MTHEEIVQQLEEAGWIVSPARLAADRYPQYHLTAPNGMILGQQYGQTMERLASEGFFGNEIFYAARPQAR